MASGSAHASPTQSAAAHLPPQLAKALGDQASRVAELCFVAPGIPWSAQLLDDMLIDLQSNSPHVEAECEARGVRVRACITLMRGRKRSEKASLAAYLLGKRTDDSTSMALATIYRAEGQPLDRAGLRKQIEWCREVANHITRRGYCERCYGERPTKRLRLSGTQVCCQCLLERCIRVSDA